MTAAIPPTASATTVDLVRSMRTVFRAQTAQTAGRGAPTPPRHPRSLPHHHCHRPRRCSLLGCLHRLRRY
eukprot:3399608-Prymnesium_polylepis.1